MTSERERGKVNFATLSSAANTMGTNGREKGRNNGASLPVSIDSTSPYLPLQIRGSVCVCEDRECAAAVTVEMKRQFGVQKRAQRGRQVKASQVNVCVCVCVCV